MNDTNREPLPAIDLEELDPGIRGAVHLLRSLGFDTQYSGDGSKAGELGCAWDIPMIAIFTEPEDLVSEARRLHKELTERGWPLRVQSFDDHEDEFPDIYVQASFDPVDGSSVILMMGEALRDIVPAPSEAPVAESTRH